MTDIIGFVKSNFITENGSILMFDVPASRFNEFNTLYGTSFQGIEGIIRIRLSIADFIKQYLGVFRDVTDGHSTYDIYMKLLYYDERKGIGNAPFFRYKIIESLQSRVSRLRLLGQKPDGELPVPKRKVQPFVPYLR